MSECARSVQLSTSPSTAFPETPGQRTDHQIRVISPSWPSALDRHILSGQRGCNIVRFVSHQKPDGEIGGSTSEQMFAWLRASLRRPESNLVNQTPSCTSVQAARNPLHSIRPLGRKPGVDSPQDVGLAWGWAGRQPWRSGRRKRETPCHGSLDRQWARQDLNLRPTDYELEEGPPPGPDDSPESQ
jgi:hypothetical protein